MLSKNSKIFLAGHRGMVGSAILRKLKLEKSISLQTSDKLKKIGYDIEYEQDSIGGGQAIYIDRKKGLLIAGSDSRKDGSAIGY